MFKKVGIKVAVMVNLVLLVVMAAGTWYIVDQQGKSLESQLLERGRIEALVGAKLIGKVMDEAIDNGVFSVKAAFDQDYVPIPGFEPAKYHTQYDAYLDKAILAMEDEFLQDDSVVFAVAVDVNGYLPTHNTRYQKAITGDKQKDLVGNRTKRMFNDPVGIKAARNLEPVLQQVYNRDTGETMWDISAPIRVKGKHWGGFRIGFSLEKTQQAKSDLTLTLGAIMLGILLLSTVLVFIIVNGALAPLTRLTRIAGDLADGRVGEKIEKLSQDEIGQLADVLERLRVSLKAAMERLTRVK
ncbi:HAMP domain-containing protein [Geopsychrobacter electrodiphilus]|uniref:HAMP domain-containing protein n=1 Tax=Geopsychrobacter electrodiphilus TaxID=225196 RepID=UPI000379B96A|nr:HAMP domain-containing protein [Geopsychrobacter electrodiphilus]